MTSSIVLAQPNLISFREAVSVNVETQVVKKLETAREHIIEGQWDIAVSILQELIDSNGDTLVPAEPGRYLNTGDYCHLLISQFPDVGLTAYRSRVDSQAEEWFESGRKTFDEQPLLRVVNSAFNSSVGDDALWLLGELAFEQGQFALARQYWSLLVPPLAQDVDPAAQKSENDQPTTNQSQDYLTHPDPLVSREEVLARLVLCSIFEGNIARAKSEHAVCVSKFPDATGKLAGQTGKLVEILSDVLSESANWHDVEVVHHEKAVPGGRFSRSGLSVSSPQTHELIWRRAIPPNRFQGPASRMTLETEAPSPFFPLADKNSVFICGADSVFAFDLATGRPKWAIDENDDGCIFSNILERPVTPHLPSAGMAWYSLSLSEGRLYARMGPPVTRRSQNEGNSFSEIVGLDVGQREGELVFHVTSDVLDLEAESPEATSWSFEGTPVVANGRVYVSARRGFPEDETIVACFDENSSRLLWKRKVCASRKSASERFNLIGQNLLTLGDGRLFLCTGTGAIAALDSLTGRIQWVVTYQPRNKETSQELSDPRRHGLTPCVYDRGVVYAAPDDADLVFALDATTGQLIWRQQYPDRILHIVGVVEGRLIFSGQSVWAVDATTGAAAWPQRIGFADPAGRGFGRPALSHDFLYWPTRDEILRIDHRRGDVVERIRLREDFGQPGGNLLIADGKLLIAQSERLVALGPVSRPAAFNHHRDAGFPPEPNRFPTAETIETTKGRSFIRKVSLQNSAPEETSSIEQLSGSRGVTPTATAQQPEEESTTHNHLWPARRTWQTTLPEGSTVWFPEQHTASDFVGTVVSHAEKLKFLNPDDGKQRWTASVSDSFKEIVVSENVLVIAGQSGIVARDINDGRLVWRRLLRHDDSGRQQIRLSKDGHCILAISESQAACIEVQSGDELWRWPVSKKRSARAAREHFPAAWVAGEDRLFFRAAGDSDYSLLDLKSGQLLRRGKLPFDAVRIVSPGPDEKQPRSAIIGFDSDRQARATQLAELGIRWQHKPSSTIYGNPKVLIDRANLILVEDKQFAVRLHTESGALIWRRPISLTPLDYVDLMTELSSSYFFVASDKLVRAFQIESGEVAWETFLGSGQWVLRLSNDRLVCIQTSPAVRPDNYEKSNSSIIVLDASTGEAIQRLRFDSELCESNVNVHADSCVVRSGNELIGFSRWPALSRNGSAP